MTFTNCRSTPGIMSEYQYYEFRALDAPLSDHQLKAIRALSTRAELTPTSFINEYHFGDFKGNPNAMMEKYYDAFLYFANWGTRRLMLRLPSGAIGNDVLKHYCPGDGLSFKKKGKNVILEFHCEGESDYWEEPPALSSLTPLRNDILSGDLRSLYLGWLACVQRGEVEDKVPEPPVPAGLGSLTTALQSFAKFLCLDTALIAVAAKISQKPVTEAKSQRRELTKWVNSLTEPDRTKFLLDFLDGKEPNPRAKIMRRFLQAKGGSSSAPLTKSGRTAGDLISLYRGRKNRKE